MKQLTLELTSLLREDTPRDTSWARANWIPSIGLPSRDIAGTRAAPSTQLSEAGQAEVATRYRIKDGPIYISNNVPYIQALNDGHSLQAPAGFVEILRDRALHEVIGK